MGFSKEVAIVARESRGLTQTALADTIGVAQSKVSKWESGELIPSDEDVQQFAAATHYLPTLFFQQVQLHGIGLPEFYHRALSRAKAKDVRALHAQCNVTDIQIRALLRSVELPESKIPRIDPDEFDGDVERIAWLVRAALNVPPGPIIDLVSVIERAGGLVIDRNLETDDVDALCHWQMDLPPLFYVNCSKPACRMRFSLAHELGHTVMHWKPTENELAEEQANRFAAEFMLPAKEMRLEIPPNLKESHLAHLKVRWRMSMGAILERANRLRLIDSARYKSMRIAFSRKRWNRYEPVTIDREVPSSLAKVFTHHLQDLGYSKAALAQIMFVREQELEQMLTRRPTKPMQGEAPALRLVH